MSRTSNTCDLLLLNCSNFSDFPLFPYAFTQVSALARGRGLRVARADLLHVPRARMRHEIERLVARHRPRVVGITIRQNDSLMVGSYTSSQHKTFFPLATTKAAICELRELTRAPILVGGIGFSIHPDRIFRYLEPDYGCVGCADDVISQFETIARRQSGAGVANLIYREESRLVVPERTYFDPHDDREWDDTLVDELFAFYGRPHLASDATAVPVEVMRGCPFRCYFCAEPLTKGKKWRTRSLDVVRAELQFLISRDLRYFWFIASELNIDGPDFLRELAEMMVRIREEHRRTDLIWSGYALPWKTTRKDFDLLRRSGYRIGWNDFQSFSDENLKKTRVPYRVKDVMPFLEAASDPELQAPSMVPGEGPASVRFALFLGNAFVDAKTVSETLRYVDEIELQRVSTKDTMLIEAVRVFDWNAAIMGKPEELKVFAPEGEAPEPFLHPTFQYPKALLDALGSVRAYHEFFNFIGETFLSRAHLLRKDWNQFLAGAISLRRFTAWVRMLDPSVPDFDLPAPFGADVRALFARLSDPRNRDVGFMPLFLAPPLNAEEYPQLARILLDAIEAAHQPELRRVKRALGLRSEPRSEYQLMAHLYRRYDSLAAVVEDVERKLNVGDGSVEVLLLRKYLFRNNVVIDPRYRALLFGP